MSNEVTKFFETHLAALEELGLDEDTLAVAGAGSQNNKRISIKGGVFRKIVGGKEAGAIEDRHMNVVFAKMAHDPSRTYYSETYQEGVKISPVCWSSNARTPDPQVKTPQASECKSCPWSTEGSGQNGKGKACKLSWRTAVVLPNDPAGDVMQLVLPAASVFGDEENGRWPFKSYIQMLANRKIRAGAVVTKMSFDTKFPAPRVLFSPVGIVPPEDLGIVKRQGESDAAENAVKLTVYHRDEAEAPAPAAEAVNEVVEEVAEPVVRQQTAAANPEPEKDVSDTIKKWASKKK